MKFFLQKNLKKELAKFLAAFFVLYIIVFAVLNITGWFVRPKGLQEQKNEDKKEFASTAAECNADSGIDRISIPKIGIEAPLVFPDEYDTDFIDDLNKGVVHFPESKLPGEKGETIFLGHSAPLGWPKIRYDWVFSDLKNLESEDEIYIFFENCQYIYQVINKYFLDKGEDLPNRDLTNLENVLILISCWPPGKDFKRIAVEAILVN